jgi:type II secretory pathway predicted ATPase ExeA
VRSRRIHNLGWGAIASSAVVSVISQSNSGKKYSNNTMKLQLNGIDKRLDILETAIERLSVDANRITKEMCKASLENQAAIAKQRWDCAKDLAALCQEQSRLVEEYSLTLRDAIAATYHRIETAEATLCLLDSNLYQTGESGEMLYSLP